MPKGENSKKAAGNAKKAEVAAQKQAAKDSVKKAAEDADWAKGEKSNAKAKAAAEKAEEKRKANEEKAALKAKEEAELPKSVKPNPKAAQKKSKGIDDALGGLDGPGSKPGALNATGIDNALDALNITGGKNEKIETHPERRFPAAFKKYQEKRLEEMEDEKGLRRNQKIDQIRKEFEKHPDNPFNQVRADYNASRDEKRDILAGEKSKTEARLTGAQ